MLKIERQQEIVDMLKVNKSMSVAKLAKKLFIGEATIRRDLDKLEKQGLIKRAYGGAVWIEGLDNEVPLYIRENCYRTQKDAIGKAAARLVNDGDVIFMDSSSTTSCMAKYLSHLKKLTVITNGAKTAVSFENNLDINIYSTGGRLRKKALSYVGDRVISFVDDICVDTLFFSCKAFSLEKGFFDSSIDEVELRKVLIKNSKKIIFLGDSGKVDVDSFYRICQIDAIDCIITDIDFSAKDKDILKENNVEYIKC